jgi:hypothetical protein
MRKGEFPETNRDAREKTNLPPRIGIGAKTRSPGALSLAPTNVTATKARKWRAGRSIQQ